MAGIPDGDVLQRELGGRRQPLDGAIGGDRQDLAIGATGPDVARGREGKTVEMIPALQRRRGDGPADRLRLDEQPGPEQTGDDRPGQHRQQRLAGALRGTRSRDPQGCGLIDVAEI
ncbi:hypothetical protein D9M71_527600 [compost metagenome]